MPHKKRNSTIRIIIFELCLLVITGVTFWYVNRCTDGVDWIFTVLSGVLVLLIVLSTLIFSDIFNSSKLSPVLVLSSFAISVVFMMLAKNHPEVPIWLAGGIITSTLVDSGLGLFFAFFMNLQVANLGDADFAVYLIHLVCTTFICLRIKKVKAVKDIVYMDTIAACSILSVFIVCNILHMVTVPESTLFLIILTYIILITASGIMKLSFKNLLNKDTEANKEENSDSLDIANGFAYLNEVATDLSSMEKLDETLKYSTQAAENSDTSLEAILDAEINELQVSDVEPITDYQAPAGLSPVREMDADYQQIIDRYTELLVLLKATNKQAYIRSMRVAALAESCAREINANHLMVKAIAYLYQLDTESLDIPEKLSNAIYEVNCVLEDDAQNSVILSSKEAAIIYITHQIAIVFFFMKASKSTAINTEKIVDKALSAAILKGSLSNSGLSLKECSEVRNYLIEKLNSLV